MITKYIDVKGLEYFAKHMKEYVNMKVELSVNKKTHCPNCGALIASSKCDYCGTDFEQSAIWGISK